MMPIGAFIGDAFTAEERKQLKSILAKVLPGPAVSNEKFITLAGETVAEYRQLWVPLMTSTGALPAQFERLAKAGSEFRVAVEKLNEQARSLMKQHLVVDEAIASFSEIDRAAEIALLAAQAAKHLSRSKQRFRNIDMAKRAFIEILAKRYAQIYNERPSCSRGGVFYEVLEAISNVCDGQMNVKERTLKGILSRLSFSEQPLSRGRKRRAK
jgi:hypothetical protein